MLWYKRLKQGTFAMPGIEAYQSQIRWPDLVMMIEEIRVECSVQLPRYQVTKTAKKHKKSGF